LDGAGADAQDVTAATCKVVHANGQPVTPDELAKLDDPVAKRILRGGCPQTLNGMFDALAKSPDCKQGSFSSHLVSEHSVLTGKPDVYRGVVSQDCSGGTDHDLFLSVFGIDPTAADLPQDGTELIGRATSGVFDFYVHENATWKFMGTSADAVSGGYTCGEKGDCEPNAAQKARCWACHESGGLNMKEINSPWFGWDFAQAIPGGTDIYSKFKRLGKRADAVDMETRVENGNTAWDKTRVEVLKTVANPVQELLRPLFCTLTANIQFGIASQSPVSFWVAQPNNGFVPFKTLGFSPPGIFTVNTVDDNGATYNALLLANGQKITDAKGKQLVGPKGPVVDEGGASMFATKGDIDDRYLTALVDANVVDADFILDVLHVDFTRPIFSPTRFSLLSAAPNLSGADLTSARIRAGFVANLASAQGAGAELLASLNDQNDATAHLKDVEDFLNACKARTDKRALLSEVLEHNDDVKAALRAHRTQTPDGAQGIIEFAETLPIDNLKPSSHSFDKACTLK
jgi:hypothetical protein